MSKDLRKYLIVLKPLGKYYFGGDMTFQVGNDEKNEFNEAYASYIVESAKFPQQTSLLGMMRYLILTKSPEAFSLEQNRIIEPSIAKTLIGKGSFNVMDNHDELNYGKIESLGPCFLRKDDEALLPVPKDYHFNVSFRKREASFLYNSRVLKLPEIEGYSAKEDYESLYIGIDTGTIYTEDDIFLKDVRIGINKSYNGKSQDKGFYKQISYRLKDDVHFSFVVDCSFDFKNCQNEIVSLGADGSKFSLSATEITDMNLHYPENSMGNFTGGFRVVLLSDTFLCPSDLTAVDFSITEMKPFRFLSTTINETNYNIASGIKRNADKYYLYEKGSVFYFAEESNATAFMESIMGKKEFYQIGYNYSIIK